jgi:hypothetical protein
MFLYHFDMLMLKINFFKKNSFSLKQIPDLWKNNIRKEKKKL